MPVGYASAGNLAIKHTFPRLTTVCGMCCSTIEYSGGNCARSDPQCNPAYWWGTLPLGGWRCFYLQRMIRELVSCCRLSAGSRVIIKVAGRAVPRWDVFKAAFLSHSTNLPYLRSNASRCGTMRSSTRSSVDSALIKIIRAASCGGGLEWFKGERKYDQDGRSGMASSRFQSGTVQ